MQHNTDRDQRDYEDAVLQHTEDSESEMESGEIQVSVLPEVKDESSDESEKLIAENEVQTTPRIFQMQDLDKSFAPRPDEWSEPIFSQTEESTAKMYTPGIYIDQPGSRRRSYEQDTERNARITGGRAGRLMRAVCLILICAITSCVASYITMEYRFNRGDFKVVNQVVLGGTANGQQNASLLAPVSVTDRSMSAEDIYDMACTQVVSIKTRIEFSGGFFSGMIPSSASTESGSGFIISSDGYILTNYHVVETAYQNELPLMVTLNDGTEHEASVIGFDRNNDVALIKISAVGLK